MIKKNAIKVFQTTILVNFCSNKKKPTILWVLLYVYVFFFILQYIICRFKNKFVIIIKNIKKIVFNGDFSSNDALIYKFLVNHTLDDVIKNITPQKNEMHKKYNF